MSATLSSPSSTVDAFVPAIEDLLHEAIDAGDLAGVQQALQKGADPQAGRPFSPLCRAIRRHQHEIAEVLLDAGVDVNADRPQGISLLYELAEGYARHRKVPLFRRLLAAGATLERPYPGHPTALHAAAGCGNQELCLLLRDAGVPLDATDVQGRTALTYAVREGHLAVARWLIAQGAPLGYVQRDGSSDLHEAARQGQPSLCRLLIEQGVPAGRQNSRGDTALHLAARAGFDGTCQALVSMGSDPNARNHDGETPLHQAILGGHTRACSCLLEAGANREARDAEGLTPLQRAESSPRLHPYEKNNFRLLLQPPPPLNETEKETLRTYAANPLVPTALRW